ncbi:DUF4238 domain-containing protein [Paenibacillus macerans]|uniref:DUF4238 domain-containing protein n=1 Tax=Paenibacillus macerans TaxID=44252 RepID=A0A090Y3F7_PAEMA|nr:DUF4238 domain-containing protein [Paenibacillus macerans]KFM92954.1 hypothetical protein DJ90_2903 [Paenibacillus macerans]MCY7558522.1 DUF4238 domain-containing protein [Paenibacillus macerans]MEC0153971.1 DUF4238 domain-containing protein [Paenibacillus macerans]SUA84758.1 Uncharacterised protein [Paenibacillus macerans]
MTKKKHHFVPASHLALFTQDGTKDSILWVFDQKNGNQWDAVPESVGYQKHLYRVDLPDTEPDAIEDVFACVEENTVPIIKEICNSRKMPEGNEEYNWLINYIALLAERTPVRLDHFTKPIIDISKIISQSMLATPERFEAIKENIRKDGVEFDDNVSYEELKDFVFEEKYTISVDNNTRITTLMNAIDAIIPVLGARNWTVAYSPPEIGDFICSDNPVSLHWTTQKDRGIWSSPGHGLLETQVSVPLSSRIMLLGRFEELPPNVVISSKRNLAILNSYTGMYSDRFIFSKENDFIWFKQDNTIGNIADFKRLIVGKGTQNDESVEFDF